jgi:hypothetical protein
MPPVSPTRGGGGTPTKRRRRTGSNPTGPTKMDRANERIHRDQVEATSSNSKAQNPPAPSAHAMAAAARAARKKPQEKLDARQNKADQKKRANALKPRGSNNGSSGSSSNYSGAAAAKNAGKDKDRKGRQNKHAGKGKGKGPSGSSGSTGNAPATSTSLKDRAMSAVDLMLNPKLNALQREGDIVESEYSKQKTDLDTQTGKQLSDLATTYKQLDNMLAGYATESNKDYSQAAGTQQQGFDQLLASLQGNSQQNNQGVADEFARLGITGDVSQLNADQQFQQGLAQQNKAQAAATMAAMQANQSGYNQNTRGNQQAVGTQAQTVAKQSAVDMLNDLLFQRNTKARDVNSQMSDVQGQRGSLINQLMEQYEQQAYERMMEAQQQQFANQMGVNEFNLKSDAFNADQAYRQAQLELEGKGLEIDAQKAKQSAQKDNAALPTGFTGAQSYLQNNVRDPKRQAALAAILQRVDTHRQRGDGYHDWSQSSYSDFGKIMNWMTNFLDEPGYRRFDDARSRSLLSQALQAYFGKL